MNGFDILKSILIELAKWTDQLNTFFIDLDPRIGLTALLLAILFVAGTIVKKSSWKVFLLSLILTLLLPQIPWLLTKVQKMPISKK